MARSRSTTKPAGARHAPRRLCPALSATLLAATAAVAAGCSSTAVERDGPTITLPHLEPAGSTAAVPTTAPGPHPAPHSGLTTTPARARAAAAAWSRSMSAFYEAAESGHPEDPTFVDTLVPGGPVFTNSIAYLTELQTSGAIGPATWRVGNATALEVTAARAVVSGCSFDAGSRWKRSGAPAPAALGGGAGYTATRAVLVWNRGRWLVLQATTTQTTPEEAGPCHGF